MHLLIKGNGKGLEIQLAVTWRSLSALVLALTTLGVVTASNIHRVVALLGW
jgi:hypothetical protein